jgi:hypothetical protein
MEDIKMRSLPQSNVNITTQHSDDSQSIPASQKQKSISTPINNPATLRMGTITAQTKTYKYTRRVTPLYVDGNRAKFVKGQKEIYGEGNYDLYYTTDMVFVHVNQMQPDDLEGDLQLRGFIPLPK